MRPSRLVFVLALVTLAMGCDNKNPTRPSGAVTGLAITGADAVLTGVSATYSGTATLPDGSTRTVAPAWTSSNPGVASVDSAGRLDGRAHGSTNLTATYEGRTASKTVQVVNNYQGTWNGSYIIRACTDTGDLTNHDGGWCLAGPGRVGTVEGIVLTLVQSGDNLSQITATIRGFRETISGVVTADGRLNLSGTLSVSDYYYYGVTIATLQVGPWDTNLDGTGGMTGRWAEDYTSFVYRKGTAHMENEFVRMTRTSTQATAASASR